MKPQTIEELQKQIGSLQNEIESLKKINELVAKQASFNSRVINLLVAAGFVTEEKVSEARAFAQRD